MINMLHLYLKSRSFFYLTIFIFTSTSLAQKFIHKSYSVEDGLVQSQVMTLHKDRQGYLWIGTMDGISRWNGIAFENFRAGDSLIGKRIYDIFEDRNGKLYFAVLGEGVNIYDRGRWSSWTPENGLPSRQIASVFQSRDGTLYMGTLGDGVVVYKDGRFSVLNPANGFPATHVLPILEAQDGTLYFGTRGDGVVILENGHYRKLTTADGLPDDKVWSIAEGGDGTIYFGTFGGGLCFYRDGMVQKVLNSRNGLSNDVILDIYPAPDGTLYLGTRKGLNIYRDGEVEVIGTANGLSNEMVTSHIQDEDGTFYLGTYGGGIQIFNNRRFVTFDQSSGLRSNIVMSIYQDEQGTYYFGYENRGLSMLSHSRWRHWTTADGLASNRIQAIFKDSRGRLYFGTYEHGISIYENGHFKTLDSRNGLPDNFVQAICQLDDGTICFSTYNGLVFYRDGKLTILNTQDGLVDNRIVALHRDAENRLYIGTWNGLSIYHNGTFTNYTEADGLADNHVNCILKAHDGRIWLGTDKGVSILHRGEFLNITTRQGLSHNTVYGILEDKSGKFYLSTENGLNVITFTPDTFSIRIIQSGEGLPSNEFVQSAYFKDHQGYLWFGTVRGAVRIDPRKDVPYTTPPPVYISRVQVFDRDISPSAHTPAFPYNQNYFKFEFIGIRLAAPEQVRYRYRLSSIDPDWVETSNRYVQYTNLDNGTYTFEVQAANEWGYWSEPVQFRFTIRPAWWETWWFRMALVLIIALILWTIYRVRVAQLLAIERTRVRIAQDLHDGIGADLTHIYMQSEMLENGTTRDKIHQLSREIRESIQETIQSLSDAVWSIDARRDRLGDLVERMEDLAYQLLSPRNIRFHFQMEGLDKSRPVDGNFRHQVFMIYREALNNIVRHSRATEVDILISNSRKQFYLKISDNGIGLQPDRKNTGNGLRNMQERAKKIRGELSLNSDQGVTVKLRCPPVK